MPVPGLGNCNPGPRLQSRKRNPRPSNFGIYFRGPGEGVAVVVVVVGNPYYYMPTYNIGKRIDIVVCPATGHFRELRITTTTEGP